MAKVNMANMTDEELHKVRGLYALCGIKLPEWIDEFQFCDDDVVEAFSGGETYHHGLPLVVQLIREIRLL